MFSVIIPAHNESEVIARCLEELTREATPGEMEIVVVCNGCQDDTAEIARRFPYPVEVLETEVSSKVHALNLGDKAARSFPRLYVDADVVLTTAAARKVAEALGDGFVLAAAPSLHVDVRDASWAVRAFYRIWLKLPYVSDSLVGSGVYALSDIGRKRFDEFPECLGEDDYVRVLFPKNERASLASCRFTVFPPRRLGALIRIRARRRIGSLQVDRLLAEPAREERIRHRRGLQRLMARPWLWPDLAVYCYVALVARARGARRLRRGELTWDKDQSSRTVADA